MSLAVEPPRPVVSLYARSVVCDVQYVLLHAATLAFQRRPLRPKTSGYFRNVSPKPVSPALRLNAMKCDLALVLALTLPFVAFACTTTSTVETKLMSTSESHSESAKEWSPTSFESCYAEPPNTNVSEISIRREGGNCYILPLGVESDRPVLVTGPCTGYSLTLHSDGTADYSGEKNVPVIGRRIGIVDCASFQHLARLALEMRFEDLEYAYSPKTKSPDWACVTTDGEGPVTVSMTVDGVTTTVHHDQNGPAGPEWLGVFEREIERVAENIAWR